ncbi:hypothetical protein PDESU_04718 [Pontiella desulfatans]|uniref:RND efflux pump membrane fusion protein barrel-sandwich domain-containing protein n=1 Tax=Pontiella desulfatans TaxID=2750659 RepID=A0A6C2U7Q3_PONDE|nr:hypothetical protein [Pontiella desulfatans]VGO16128.1 hypothetical protein PDESU_04718 [Pontiella desulfatans]
MLSRFVYLSMAAGVACLLGCSERGPAPVVEPEAVVVRELSGFPSSTSLMLGEFQAQVKPLISIPVTAPSDGDILFHVEQTRQILPKGTLWAEAAPEQIAGEELALELNTRNEKLRLESELQLAERELERVEFMMADPALRDLPYEDRVPLSTNIVQQLQGELDLLKKQLESCGVVERLAFRQKALRSRIEMPFDGELLISLPVTPKRKMIRVAANTPVGTMRDISEIYLHIIIRDPQTVAIPTDQLMVEFKRDSGDVLRGRFHDTQIVEMGNQDVLVYRFGFAPEKSAELTALIGANLTCDLWVEAGQAFHSVSKLEVARMLGGNDSFADWREVVEELWPGATLLFTGRTHLGIVAKGAAE